MQASLIGVGYGLKAWTVWLSYDVAVLSLQSHAVDGIWSDAVEEEETGLIKILVNQPTNDDETNTDVQGADIPILTADFVISSSAAAGSYADSVRGTIASTSAAAHAAALPLTRARRGRCRSASSRWSTSARSSSSKT